MKIRLCEKTDPVVIAQLKAFPLAIILAITLPMIVLFYAMYNPWKITFRLGEQDE